MPITRELDNIRKLESVGFSHEQAKTMADVIEQSHVNGQQSLKEFIHEEIREVRNEIDSFRKDVHNELGGFRNEIGGFRKDVHSELDGFRKDIGDLRKEVHTEINSLEWRIKASHTDLLLKIFAIVVGCTSLAIAIVKVLD